MSLARLSEIQHEIGSLLHSYPRFVGLRGDLQVGEIPVFVFHTIEPLRFEAQLRYLVDNGYRTIGLDEFTGILSERLSARGGEVLLTIDDARSSVWRFGCPLLRRYGCRAALFAITGWTPEGAGVRPSLDSPEPERRDLKFLHGLDPGDETSCTWEELRAMRSCGAMDVESHSHLHQRLFVASQMQGLVQRNSVRTAADAVFSPYLSCARLPLHLSPEHFLGFPLFATRPLLEAPAALHVPREIIAVCTRAYRQRLATAENLGALQLRALVRELAREVSAASFRPWRQDELEQAIREDLRASQEALRAGFGDGSAGRDLCLPFTGGSVAATRIARELGFRSIFWGVMRSRRTNFAGTDALGAVRIKNDFIWRLPGRNRRSILGIYTEKLTRRLSGVSPY